MEQEDRIQRVKKMTQLYRQSRQATDGLLEALEQYRAAEEGYQQLAEYYFGPQWLADVDADRAGLLPQELNRGILTEDTLWDLVTDRQRLRQVLAGQIEV